MTGFRAHRFTVGDGTQLYYRDYGDRLATKTPVVCLSGVDAKLEGLSSLGAAPFRRPPCSGNGLSRPRTIGLRPQTKHYVPDTYVRDVLDLAAVTGIHHAIFIGTSLGGLVSMGLAVGRPTLLAGVVLNDIGPEIPVAALKRIGAYAGKADSYASWDDAIAECKNRYGLAHPKKTEADWAVLAHDSFVEKNGRIVPDYDIAITKAKLGEPPDLWALFGAFANVPVLAMRGALSDVLTEETFDKMATAKPDLERLTVADCGHNPTLEEPEVTAALDAFIARIDAQQAHG